MNRLALLPLLALAACANPPAKQAEAPSSQPPLAREAARIVPERRFSTVDYLIVDKSERLMIAYAGGQPVKAWRGLQFGDAPSGHKQFEGDGKTPEGQYFISHKNPDSNYHLSLGISYPNEADIAFAESQGKSPGGEIFIHGGPNTRVSKRDWTWGCIALTDKVRYYPTCYTTFHLIDMSGSKDKEHGLIKAIDGNHIQRKFLPR